MGAKHQGVIVSIVDRVSKFTWLSRLDRGTLEAVAAAIVAELGSLGSKHLIHTLTSDNGKEFAGHDQIIKGVGGDFYFAKPYHSWEQGLNEHTNGLVRQYFP